MNAGRIIVYGLRENARYTLVRSPQWSATRELLARADVQAMWSRRLRGWCVRTEHIGDVLAIAQLEGVSVVMRGALEESAS